MSKTEYKRLGDYIREVNVRNWELKVMNRLSQRTWILQLCYPRRDREKGWSLVPNKYIEFRNRDEQIDFDTKMKQLQAEMRNLLQQEEESKQQLKELFKSLGYGI